MTSLFKQRNFSDFFSDTIAFLKENGKDFFKNYIIINGVFLMILMVMIYFITKVYFESFLGGMNNPDQASMLSDLMQENAVLLVIISLIFGIIIILISMLSYAYPIVYMDLYEINQGKKIELQQIIQALKNNTGRLFVFFLGSLFIVLPLLIITFVVCVLLCFILIGIPLLFIVLPAFISWYSISFFDYLTNKSSFFGSLSNGFRIVKCQFWAVVGGTFLMVVVIQILQSIVIFVPYMAGLAYYFASAEGLSSQNATEAFGFMTILVAIVFILSILISYLLNNFLIVSQGMMYYSGRELDENNQAFLQINNIGNNFE